MTKAKLKNILARHKKWLNIKDGGRRADLSYADLRNADLCNADLSYADLSYADLRGADLSNADLHGADLRGANLYEAVNVPDMPWTSIVPEVGSFIGWKKVRGRIVKLEILADAKRCNATGRKCRCSAAKVLEIQNPDGSAAEISSVTNTNYNPHVTYTVGETVLPDSFDDNRWNECSHGIHFFITRQEAVDY